MMSKITESGLAGHEHESDGDATDEEGHDTTRKYEPSLSLSGDPDLSWWLGYPISIFPAHRQL